MIYQFFVLHVTSLIMFTFSNNFITMAAQQIINIAGSDTEDEDDVAIINQPVNAAGGSGDILLETDDEEAGLMDGWDQIYDSDYEIEIPMPVKRKRASTNKKKKTKKAKEIWPASMMRKFQAKILTRVRSSEKDVTVAEAVDGAVSPLNFFANVDPIFAGYAKLNLPGFQNYVKEKLIAEPEPSELVQAQQQLVKYNRWVGEFSLIKSLQHAINSLKENVPVKVIHKRSKIVQDLNVMHIPPSASHIGIWMPEFDTVEKFCWNSKKSVFVKDNFTMIMPDVNIQREAALEIASTGLARFQLCQSGSNSHEVIKLFATEIFAFVFQPDLVAV